MKPFDDRRHRVMIGRHAVKLVSADIPTMIWTWGGRKGQYERGVYALWTAVLKRPVKGMDNGKLMTVIPARCRVWMSPGDRFDRMKDEMLNGAGERERTAYRYLWEKLLKRGLNIKHIRPATKAEVSWWAETHREDWDYVMRLEYAP